MKNSYNYFDEAFLAETARNNAVKAYLTSMIGCSFGIALLLLDVLRYTQGYFDSNFPAVNLYRFFFFLHLVLISLVIPGYILKKNMTRIKANNYSSLDEVLLLVLLLAGIALIPMGLMAIQERGSMVGFAMYIIVVNHFFLINFPRRLAINIFCFFSLLVGIYFLQNNVIHRYVYLVEGIGILLPSFFISNVQMRMGFENFLNKQKLEAQNQSIQDKNKQLMIRSLQGQMNPHFIFNTLNSIQHFMVSQDQRSSMDYLGQFAKLMRLIFKYSSENSISLENEIEFLQLYLNLEKLRFEQKMEVYFDIDPDLEDQVDSIYLPPLMIQPLIENAFKHGLMHLEKDGVLNIRLCLKDSCFKCYIEDNGVGVTASKDYNYWHGENKMNNKIGQKSALDIIRQRLEIFNDMLPLDAPKSNQLFMEDLKKSEGKSVGTKVVLTLCIDLQRDIYYKNLMEETTD